MQTFTTNHHNVPTTDQDNQPTFMRINTSETGLSTVSTITHDHIPPSPGTRTPKYAMMHKTTCAIGNTRIEQCRHRK